MCPFFHNLSYDCYLLTVPVCNNTKCGGCHEKAILFTDGRYLQVTFHTYSAMDGEYKSMKVMQTLLSPWFWCRKDDKRVKELFEALDKTKVEFESIERPLLDIESPARTSSSSSSRSPSLKTTLDTPLSDTAVPKKLADDDSDPDSKKGSSEKEDAAKNQLELELDDGEELLADEINDWEFDALDDTHFKNQ